MDQRLLKMLDGNEDIYPHLLEARFPRVFNKLLELSETTHLEVFLQDLLMDKHGGERAGFPPEVAREIFRLGNFLHALQQQEKEISAWDEVPQYKRDEVERCGYEFTPQGLLKSVEDGNQDAVQVFLSCGVDLEVRDERDWTPLMISSFNGNEAFALLLIKCGAKIATRDKAGYTPLHWAAYNGFSNVVKMLLEKGADPNVQSQFGWTALMQAATRGHLLACAYLLAQGADVNLASVDGWTALHKAANNGHTQIVKLLLEKGANRLAQYQDGNTPLDLATKAEHQDIIALLNSWQARSV
jgi:ankyrin repeat protein